MKILFMIFEYVSSSISNLEYNLNFKYSYIEDLMLIIKEI